MSRIVANWDELLIYFIEVRAGYKKDCLSHCQRISQSLPEVFLPI